MTPLRRALVLLLAQTGADQVLQSPGDGPAPSTSTSTTTEDPCPLLPCAEDVGLPAWGAMHNHTQPTPPPTPATSLLEAPHAAPPAAPPTSLLEARRTGDAPRDDVGDEQQAMLERYRSEFDMAKQAIGPAAAGTRADEMLGMLESVSPKTFAAAAKKYRGATESKAGRQDERRASDELAQLLTKSENKDARGEDLFSQNKIFRGEAQRTAPKEPSERQLELAATKEVREENALFSTPFWKRMEYIAGLGRCASHRGVTMPAPESLPPLPNPWT